MTCEQHEVQWDKKKGEDGRETITPVCTKCGKNLLEEISG